MSTAFDQLLEATIRHLEDLKAHGVRHVSVSAEALHVLSRPQPRFPAPAARPAGLTIAPARAATPAAAKPVSSAQREITLPLAISAEIQPAAGPALDPEAKSAAFAALRERVLACVKCPHLAASRTTVVFGVGSLNAELMFVGEAPGADEDKQGEPFVGKAGQLLTRILQTMGLSRSEVYIANILKCRPDLPPGSTGNRKPTPSEMETCLPYLHEQIDLIQPRVLVALGATGVEGLLGKTVGITKLRGNWKTYRGIPLMPTYHPAFLLRTESLRDKRLVWEDMLQVMEKLGLPISEKQQRFFLKG